MRTMADMRRDQEDQRKGRGKQVEHYSGGERSGMATLGPAEGAQSDPGSLNPNDPWAQARAAGAVLGQGEEPVDPNSSMITVYADGFTVNNGPLRPTTDPLNKKFLDDIHNGVCPEELRKPDGSRVDVKVTDKRQEKWSPPQQMGTQLGGNKPIQPNSADCSQGSRAGPTATGTGEVIIDSNKPTTEIMIRFGDGRRQTQQFNEDASVEELFAYVSACTGATEFKLIEGFPPKPIIDRTKTLKEAGLLKGSVTVKN